MRLNTREDAVFGECAVKLQIIDVYRFWYKATTAMNATEDMRMLDKHFKHTIKHEN